MTKNQKSSRIVAMAAGPQTIAGKKRSSRNALSHGIFAKELILDGERYEDFTLLCRRLQADLHAQDVFEECLIQQLAMLLWRKWRLLKAETAEIADATKFTNLEHFFKQGELAYDTKDALTSQHFNPLALQRSIELLSGLRDDFERRGFDLDQALPILRRIYGFRHLETGFPDAYTALAAADKNPDKHDEVSRKLGDLKARTLEEIDEELTRLKVLKSSIEEIESRRRHHAALAALLPRSEVQERLQRYEAHLSREIDRVLGQLEQYTRVRLGCRSLPAIEVTRVKEGADGDGER